MGKKIKLPILVYHYLSRDKRIQEGIAPQDKGYIVGVEDFDKHLTYLSENGYKSIDFEELLSLRDGKGIPTSKLVILTFDDGHISNFISAFSLLNKYNYKAVFFVVPDWIGKKGYMHWEDLETISSTGMSIQSHSYSHLSLTKLSEKEIEEELKKSKILIEDKTGVPVIALAVPKGYYSKRIRIIAKRVGYKIVCSSYYGINSLESDPYLLKRISIKGQEGNLNKFISMLNAKPTTAMFQKSKNLLKCLRNHAEFLLNVQ